MPDDVLLDTNVVVDLVRDTPERDRWQPHIEGKRPIVSFVTVAELWAGAYRLRYGDKKRRELSARIDTLLPVPSTDALAEEWGRVVNDAAEIGHPLGVTEKGKAHHAHDAWIAATSRLYGIPLLTANRRHFVDLPRLNLISA